MGRHERVAALARLEHLTTAPGRALTLADVGCGDGRTVRALLQRLDALAAPRVVVHALDQVSSLGEDLLADPRVRSRITDLDHDLPLADGALDAAVSLNVVEHLDDPGAHLAELHRVLRPGGVLVLAHSDWDTALFTSSDDALTRALVDRFVGSGPPVEGGAAGGTRVDGFMGRKLLGHVGGAGWTALEVTSWADPHRRFDEDSVAWKVATGMVAAAQGDPHLAGRAAGWLEDLAALATAGHFLFTVTDVAVVLRAERG